MGQPGYQNVAQEVKAPQITSSLEGLEKSISVLAENLERHKDRIGQILVPENQGQGKEQGAPQPLKAPLSLTIDSLRMRVQSLNGELSRLTERVEL